MKHRIPRAPLTLEDSNIWAHHRWVRWSEFYAGYVDADRRDAEVMYRLIQQQAWRWHRRPAGYECGVAHSALSGWCAMGMDPGEAFEL